jgi:glycerol dehydrogenase
MTQIFASPGRYIQGYKELKNISNYAVNFGKNFVVITSKGRAAQLTEEIEKSFEGRGCSLLFLPFQGECCMTEINRLVEIVKNNPTKIDCVIGLGGGKVLDTAKAVAHYAKTPIIIVPTIASNDAPVSALSVIYNEEGTFIDCIFYPKNPEIVLIDTYIIANAPARLLVAGMGDALATYYEARTCVEAYRNNFLGTGTSMADSSAGAKATATSFGLAKLCLDILLEYGVEAKLAVEQKQVTKAVDRIIEANSLLSGIGFESNGVATGHAIYCGFSALKGREHLFHGEYVAFGTIAMLVLEGRDQCEIDESVRFCLSVGLPVTFADMHLDDMTEEELDTVVAIAADPTQTSNVEPFEVTKHEMKAAILTADRIGRLYKNGGSLV